MSRPYQDTVRLLVDSFSGLTPELQKAAKFMLENPGEVGLNSMRQVAKRAGVKPATVSRLSKKLGFGGYDALREPFRQRLRKNEPKFASRVRNVQRRGSSDEQGLYDDLRAQEVENVERTLSEENYATLVAAVDTLDHSRRVYVLGLRGSHAPAFLFHYAYQLFQDNSYLVDTHAGMYADQLRGIDEQDCLLVVSFPPYTRLTIDAVEYAAAAGARIVAVTDSIVSPAAHAAGHTIITRNQSASFYHSYTGALTVIQALITLLVARKGGNAVATVREAEKRLSKASAYW